jgi:hypothetical protein
LTCSCAAALAGIAAGRVGSAGRVIARGTTCRDVAARSRLGRDHAALTGTAARGVAANALSVRQLVAAPIRGLEAGLVHAIRIGVAGRKA